ncbi:MAG: aprX [Frankiales bacterium]|nr:aprX [Frankiales bacterium]
MSVQDEHRKTRLNRHRSLRGLGIAAIMALTVSTCLGIVGPTTAANAATPKPAPVPASLVGGLLQTVQGLTEGVTGLVDDSHWGDASADKAAKGSDGKNHPDVDPGSLYTIENAIGARNVWMAKDSSGRQITGQGVGVALLDSGTAPVDGLNGAGKLTYGPDLSIESNGSLTDQDTFGHGTHLAGIIGARDAATLDAKSIPKLSPSVQLGVAPDSKLLSIKLATSDGSTDVSQIVAALNWITEHQTSADGTRIRVVNLSFGTDSLQPYQVDPVAAAAENAWRHGLVVVVSGGNEGPTAGRLTDPAIDPYVLAVGSSDGGNTPTGWSHPTVASYSSSGTASRHVDLLAPGRSVASLRAPGSFVDTEHPEGLVSGDTAGRLFRGSGTSQAAAVVSGAAALLLQAYPNLTPDQIKAALVSTATPMTANPVNAGSGQLNVSAAMTKAATLARAQTGLLGSVLGTLGGSAPNTTQSFPIATGQGSIDAARGGYSLVDADNNVLSGEVDVQGNPWLPATWWAASSSLTSWSGGLWLGQIWTGNGWQPAGSDAASARWSSARWSSARWSDAGWDSARWSSARWSSARWSSARWSDASWDSARWSDARWS